MKPEDCGEAGENMTTCETPGCSKEAKLQCPTCIKLKIQVCYCKIHRMIQSNVHTLFDTVQHRLM